MNEKHSTWKIGWNNLRRNRSALLSLWIILIFCLISLLAPLIANDKPLILIGGGRVYFPAFSDYILLKPIIKLPETPEDGWKEFHEGKRCFILSAPIPYSFKTTDINSVLRSPDWSHFMGTDGLGRDVLSRCIHGTTISLKVGVIAMGISLIIGLILGSLAGFYRGVIDVVISRIIEIVICFPTLFLILAVMAINPPFIREIEPIFKIMIVIGLISWTGIARYVRGEFMKLKEIDYTHAARAVGAKNLRIIFRHILPNSLAPVLVSASFGIAGAILAESSLSFLGLGVQPPTPSWGSILSEAQRYMQHAWWLALFPGFAIFLTVLSCNLLGEGIRDAFDPRMFEK
ncbi:MAG: ABC transporter permease [Acidobacteriota bacterium]